MILRSANFFIGKGLQLIERRLRQRTRFLQHQGVSEQILFTLGDGPHLLLMAFEGLERLGERRTEGLMGNGLPGRLPLLLEAGSLSRILAEDQIATQGRNGGNQRLLARFIPLQSGQRLLQQGVLGLIDLGQPVIDQRGGEQDQQVDKTEAEQQLA